MKRERKFYLSVADLIFTLVSRFYLCARGTKITAIGRNNYV